MMSVGRFEQTGSFDLLPAAKKRVDGEKTFHRLELRLNERDIHG